MIENYEQKRDEFIQKQWEKLGNDGPFPKNFDPFEGEENEN